jgi:hypothetical protein
MEVRRENDLLNLVQPFGGYSNSSEKFIGHFTLGNFGHKIPVDGKMRCENIEYCGTFNEVGVPNGGVFSCFRGKTPILMAYLKNNFFTYAEGWNSRVLFSIHDAFPEIQISI